jgi:N-acetylmuramoyl-L-alanine amidase
VRVAQAASDMVRVVLDLKSRAYYEPLLNAEGTELTIRLFDTTKAPAGHAMVVLDPGHGGADPGAIGPGGQQEANVTLAVARELQLLFRRGGHTVLLTRVSDTEILLEPRVALANNNHATVLISVHCNSSDNPDAYGIETYYKWTPSLPLAQSVHKSLVRSLGAPDRGVRQANFYMVNHTNMPAILAEIGYISHSAEERKLADPDYRKRVARALYEGTLAYLRRLRRG